MSPPSTSWPADRESAPLLGRRDIWNLSESSFHLADSTEDDSDAAASAIPPFLYLLSIKYKFRRSATSSSLFAVSTVTAGAEQQSKLKRSSQTKAKRDFPELRCLRRRETLIRDILVQRKRWRVLNRSIDGLCESGNNGIRGEPERSWWCWLHPWRSLAPLTVRVEMWNGPVGDYN